MMRTLTIRQPWAWAILFAGKDIENRSWPLPRAIYGQRVAIHAAKGITQDEYIDARAFIRDVARAWSTHVDVPLISDLARGCILGTVKITGCVSASDSPWFMGAFGFVLRNPQPLATPIVVKGALGFWNWEGATP